jgi:hypothetical protein
MSEKSDDGTGCLTLFVLLSIPLGLFFGTWAGNVESTVACFFLTIITGFLLIVGLGGLAAMVLEKFEK